MTSGDIIVINEGSAAEPEMPESVVAQNTQSLAAAYAAATAKSLNLSFAKIMPTLDMAKLMPKIDTRIFGSIANTDWMKSQAAGARTISNIAAAAGVMPKVDISGIWARYAATSTLRLMDTSVVFKAYTLPESFVLPKINITAGIAAQMMDVGKLLAPLFEQLRGIDWDEVLRRRNLPDNWSRSTEARLGALVAMVSQEGIPVAWVPRADVLEALLDAAPGDERSALLIARRDEILEDCAAWVDDLEDDFLASVLPVAREVLDACRSGHWRVAAISAVTVVHNVVEALHWASDHQRVAKHHRLTVNTPQPKLLEQATRGPLVLFYEDWNPKSPQPRPTHVTRHVVSHHLDADQVTERNCIVAVMLMSSLLVTVYQLELGAGERAA